MNPAGIYNRPLQHFVRTTSKDSLGGTEYTFTQDAVYWGEVKQTSSEFVDELGRITTHTKATIRLRGWYVGINPLDRLTDILFGETYIIDSLSRGDDEFIIEGHKL